MKKEFVTYEQAVALKELGFDEPCIGYYYNNKIYFNSPGVNVAGPSGEQPLPLKQQVFRWFREKHGMCSWIDRMYTENHIVYYRWTIEKPITDPPNYNNTWITLKEYSTYEEAENACIDKLIEICKNKKQ